MIRKKNGFLTFCFSLLPGAGEMYMGFMKMGVSLMSLFFLTLFMGDMVLNDSLFFVAVIVWFYSFFHVHNLAGLPDELFCEVKDAYLLPFVGEEYESLKFTKTCRRVVAVILIIIGASSLLKSFYYFIAHYLPADVRGILDDFGFYYLPRLAFSIAVILLGIYMIRGKKRQLENESI